MEAFGFDSIVTTDVDETTGAVTVNYDRAVSAQVWRTLISKLFTTGVSNNPTDSFNVSAGNGLTVTVNPGFCVIEGCLAIESEVRTLMIQAADETRPRIDTVVIRLNDLQEVRSCDLYVLTGTPSANPTRPTLTRSESIYEIGLADIMVTAGATVINPQTITDTRFDEERAGRLMVDAQPYIDTELSVSSEHPVTNSAITTKFNQVDTTLSTKADKTTITNNLNVKVESFSPTSGVLYLRSVSV